MARRTARLAVLLLALAGVAAAPAAADVSIAVRTTGVGATVQLNPPGQFTSCNSLRYCFYHFPTGSTVTLKAVPATSGSSFRRWLGACAGAGSTCSVRLDRNRSTTARFTPVQLFADEVSGKGTVSPSPVGASCGRSCWEYDYGTEVTLSAQAAPNWAFRSWSGACANVMVAGCILNMFASYEASPVFGCTTDTCQVTQPLIREVKTKVSVSGSGYVRVNGSRCRSLCTFSYNRGRSVVLRAYGSGFRYWTGWCGARTPRCQFSAFMDAYGNPPSVKAVFR